MCCSWSNVYIRPALIITYNLTIKPPRPNSSISHSPVARNFATRRLKTLRPPPLLLKCAWIRCNYWYANVRNGNRAYRPEHTALSIKLLNSSWGSSIIQTVPSELLMRIVKLSVCQRTSWLLGPQPLGTLPLTYTTLNINPPNCS